MSVVLQHRGTGCLVVPEANHLCQLSCQHRAIGCLAVPEKFLVVSAVPGWRLPGSSAVSARMCLCTVNGRDFGQASLRVCCSVDVSLQHPNNVAVLSCPAAGRTTDPLCSSIIKFLEPLCCNSTVPPAHGCNTPNALLST